MAEPTGHNNQVRREMLAEIRRHLAASAPFDAIRQEHRSHHGDTTLREVAVAPADEPDGSLVDRFRAALEAVAGHCAAVRDEDEAAEVLRHIFRQTGGRRVAISDSALVRRVIGQAQPDAELVENALPAALFDCDLGVTSAQWAVAETGTLVLESEQERHRLASLVPPVHVALVRAGRVRQTLAEVLEAISAKGANSLSRTVTFITGPSRTSDIELTLAIGVHGPAELHVIIIEGEGYD